MKSFTFIVMLYLKKNHVNLNANWANGKRFLELDWTWGIYGPQSMQNASAFLLLLCRFLLESPPPPPPPPAGLHPVLAATLPS
jgi:hypothetical protein